MASLWIFEGETLFFIASTEKTEASESTSLVDIYEIFEKCSILFKIKEGDNFNHKNTLSILRIEI